MAPQDTPGSNAAELTVSELSGALKRTIEDRFGYVRVRGEISGYRGPHSSGHAYFCLKDARARIDAVMWKGTFARLRIRPEEGMEVIATGKITTFPGKSTYQIVVESIEPAGVGALLALLKQRTEKLRAEGLFDPARKQLPPFMPRVIGVITSPTGAVIRDILHRLADRFPRHVLVWPVRVQGDTSAAEVARAIEGFNALPEGGKIPRPDVLIVARGGGSLEDLWGFNEEIVVRAAATSDIPLISAVGHETDTTLIDHAADVRAPTPTAAAEMAVPVLADLLAQTAGFAARHRAAMRRQLDARRNEVRGLVRALPGGEDVVAVPRQRLDRAGERLAERVVSRLRERTLRLGRASQLLARHSPQAEFARRQGETREAAANLRRVGRDLLLKPRQRADDLQSRLTRAFANRIALEKQHGANCRRQLEQASRRLAAAPAKPLERRAERLAGLAKLLESYSYHNVLSRGFALVRDAEGRPLRAAADVGTGARVEIEFADGRVGAIADGAPAPSPKKTPDKASSKKPAPAGQGSLF
jgi:exodeoxyribonuclease VII large subunit